MIILVRHGEATHHTMHLTGGWTDSTLTELGRQQMRTAGIKLSKYFKGRLLTSPLRILTSDLKRAKESADIIAELTRFGGQIETFSFLREKCNGQAANLTEEEAKKIYQPSETFRELDHRNYPDGETRREFFERTVKGFWQTVNMDNANVIVVTHKGVIQNIIFRWLGMNIDEVYKYNFSVEILPASVTILDINKWKEHTIVTLNDTSHLKYVKFQQN